jgi:glycylpeptide N-tetradecanoyltransferase
VYTAGVVIPHPISRNRYWHRSLNPKKLVEVGFSRLRPNTTMALMIKLYKLPESPATPGLRPMEAKDVPQVHGLLAKYLSKFKLAPELSQEDTAHWLLPRPNVIYSYVVEDPQSHAVTDIVSFYSLPSSILNNPKHSHLSAAYSYYNVYTKTPLKQLMGDALVLAKNAGFDVFNALDLMENATFFDALKFGIGDGNLQYYVYNWRCPEMKPADVGLVLL